MSARYSRKRSIVTATIGLALLIAAATGDALAYDSPLLRGSRGALADASNPALWQSVPGSPAPHRSAGFFMDAESPATTRSAVQPVQLRVPAAEPPREPADSVSQSDDTPFFLKLDTPPEPIPPPPSETQRPQPPVSDSETLPQSDPPTDRQPVPAHAPNRHSQPRAPIVRRSVSSGVGSHPLRGALQEAACGCQTRWVNWRCSSDYLQGCVPDGYTALSLIDSTPPAALYSTPRDFNGPVEPGGNEAESRFISGPDTVPMNRLTFSVAPPPGEFPDDQAAQKFSMLASRTHLPGTRRVWAASTCYWDASHLVHQPLYFEDVNLERNGYACGVAQPFISAAKFYATFPILPYLLAAEPHYSAVYTLGESRPGSPAPYVLDCPPSSPRAGVFEAAVVTGFFFVIP